MKMNKFGYTKHLSEVKQTGTVYNTLLLSMSVESASSLSPFPYYLIHA